MSKPNQSEARLWWQVMPALPTSPDSQHHSALRRIWADHTMNTSAKGRGYYRWGTEDNITPGLFQIWAIFEHPETFRPMLLACGAELKGPLRMVRWAYACEEVIAPGSFSGVSGRFLIPDIVLYFEDDLGPGTISFEVKRPDAKPNEKDAAKLSAYSKLASMRNIPRRSAVFLISEKNTKFAASLPVDAEIVTWEQLLGLMLQAASAEFSGIVRTNITYWIARAFARYEIGNTETPANLATGGYGTPCTFSAAEQLNDATPAARAFLRGSEVTEAFWRGEDPAPPAAWMEGSLTRAELSERKLQSTSDRRLCRWSPSWRKEQEALRLA